MKLDAMAHLARRTREVGLHGVARRIAHPARELWRERRRRRWSNRFAQGGGGPPLDALTGGLPLERLHATLGRSVFFLPRRDAALVEAFLVAHPVAAEVILEQARAVLKGDLGWVVPGGSPDWHAVLPGGGRWPVVEPEATGLTSDRPLGDVRLTWEIGRCPHLVRLAQAAWLTGEKAFARAAMEGIRDWIAANPPGLGIGWAHAQEVGLRAVAWLWVFQLLRDLETFASEFFEAWLVGILTHAAYVEAYLSDHVITHNHLISELAALAQLGLCLGELPCAQGWARLGISRLSHEILKQTDTEGVQGEMSTHYHAFVLDSYLAVDVLARRAGRPLALPVRQRIRRMAEFLSLLLVEDGRLPAIGDTDAGRAWRLGTDPLDRRDLLALAAIAFDDSRFGAIAGNAAGAFWIGGGAPVPGHGAPLPPGQAHCFRQAGIGVARTGFRAHDEVVVFRPGATAFRPDVQTSHAHADALSVLWQMAGHDVLVDPGVYLYSEPDGWRTALRRTDAHSCVSVDGLDQADVTSLRFGILGLRPARWLAWSGSAEALDACADHPAGGDPRVRRHVTWRKGGLLALRDEVFGQGEHEVVLSFVLPRSHVVVTGAGASALLPGGLHLRLQSFDAPLAIEVEGPSFSSPPGRGWLAPRYGLREPGVMLRVRFARRAVPIRLLTLLQVSCEALPPEAALDGLGLLPILRFSDGRTLEIGSSVMSGGGA